MAETDSPAMGKRRGREPRYYTPPTIINMPPTRSDGPMDSYTGTQDELVAAGLLPRELFPGEPGMPALSATLRPHGVPYGADWRFPGTMRVSRLLSGKFTVILAPPSDEQQRRIDAREERRRGWYEEQERLRQAEQRCGTALDDIVATLGVEAVRKHIERIHRKSTPRRSTTHLRLAWSAPGA